MARTLLLVGLVVVGVPSLLYLAWVVHLAMDRLCVRHARKFCGRGGLEIRRVRWRPEFEQGPDGGRGVKTEYTLVQLDCLDARKRRRLVLLSVWPFGVRGTVSDEPYPDAYDREWPQSA